MENEQAEQLIANSNILKIFTFGIVALFASLVAVFVWINHDAHAISHWIWHPESFRPYPLYLTTSIAFALSITFLLKILLSRPVKWRSNEFLYSLVATMLSGLILTPLLIEALRIMYLYYIA